MTFYSGETLTASDLNAMLASITTAQGQISTLQGQVATLQGQMVTANANIAALQAATADSGWVNLTMAGSWAHYGAPFPTPQCRKIGSLVVVKGLVRNGTPGTTIATLPVGFRPSEQHLFIGTDAVQFGSMVAGSPTAGNNGNTGAASAGTAHTHPLNNHQHNPGSLQPQIPNTGNRLDVTSGGGIVHNADGSNAFVSLSGIAFYV